MARWHLRIDVNLPQSGNCGLVPFRRCRRVDKGGILFSQYAAQAFIERKVKKRDSHLFVRRRIKEEPDTALTGDRFKDLLTLLRSRLISPRVMVMFAALADMGKMKRPWMPRKAERLAIFVARLDDFMLSSVSY